DSVPDRLTDERLREMEMEAAAARALLQYVDLPGESREVLRLYADGVPALIAEVRRLRAALQERLVTEWRSGHRVYYQCDECGQRADAPERIEHIACPLSDAALAEWRRVRGE